ncbi:hypothetical protein DFJ58DRAFT_265167 [Suillus subalutaceus]|uniref:uncharacterized protein n=1 Tax=Suillus subalutaceus TaxID=48586 RepID=UPI001B85D111|nr:uncharacterized protein DFJ58DRAFT_265167 [Suillus subalutaceus]KAG1861166.1 hypothetical protein DFJ58DRAFT_265167 [Suillus subalutaceus]
MCPGCTLHNNPPITGGATYASCSNPSTCAFCLDCTILSIPAGNPPPNIDSSSDPSQSQEFDEWLRQVALSPGISNSQPNFNPYELTTPQIQSYQNGRPRLPETPSPPAECCGGRCKCPRNSCACLPDCCGCCLGCQCDNHCNDARSRTTFAVSGERGLCCRKADSNTNAPSAGRRLPDFMAMTNIRDQSSASGAGGQGYYGQQGAFVDYSEAPSRSSSGSSLSSRMPTRPPSGPFSRSSRILGCWGRVARIPVVDRRRRTSDLPGVPVVLLPMRSPKGLVGLQRTRTITRRWMQCASTREACHGVNSYGSDAIALLSFLRCACLLLAARWSTDGHAVAVIAPYLYFLLVTFFLPSLDATPCSMDAIETRLERLQSFFLPITTRNFPCTLLQQQIL